MLIYSLGLLCTIKCMMNFKLWGGERRWNSPCICYTYMYVQVLTLLYSTVEPLYSGHHWGTTFQPLHGGGLCRGVWGFKCSNLNLISMVHEQLLILVCTEHKIQHQKTVDSQSCLSVTPSFIASSLQQGRRHDFESGAAK